jgi:hypothetical protein
MTMSSSTDRPPPLARSQAEADLYLFHQPCRTCGHTQVLTVRGFSFQPRDGHELRWLRTRCDNCGAQDEYAFRFPPDGQPAPDTGPLRFGGPEQSQLLDPGEWLLLTGDMVGGLPPDPQGLEPKVRRALRDRIDIALAAVGEAGKFLDPEEDVVPAVAFWSRGGYELFVSQPWLFSREQLASQAAGYQDLLARYTD